VIEEPLGEEVHADAELVAAEVVTAAVAEAVAEEPVEVAEAVAEEPVEVADAVAEPVAETVVIAPPAIAAKAPSAIEVQAEEIAVAAFKAVEWPAAPIVGGTRIDTPFVAATLVDVVHRTHLAEIIPLARAARAESGGNTLVALERLLVKVQARKREVMTQSVA